MTTSVASDRTARPVTAFRLDPAHSVAEFAVRHLMVTTVRGRFAIRSLDLTIDERDPAASRVAAEIDVASVDTGVEARDAHLRSADFFDAERHPVMVFRSKRVQPASADSGVVVGDLTIRGTTREVALRVEKEGEIRDPETGTRRVGLVGETTIDRSEFGLTWNMTLETGGVLVGDKVRITIHLAAVEVPA